MYKFLFWTTLLLLVWEIYGGYQRNKSLKRLTMLTSLLQAILIKRVGPKHAADEIHYALIHNSDDVMPDYWRNLKKQYGLPNNESWYKDIDKIKNNFERDFAASKPAIDDMYAKWKSDDN